MSILDHKDPVCGMRVEADKAAESSEFRDRKVYFCSQSCKQRFDRAPELFAANLED